MKKLHKRFVVIDLVRMGAAVHIVNNSGIGSLSTCDVEANNNIEVFYNLVKEFQVKKGTTLYEA